jgi:hypothetical protein
MKSLERAEDESMEDVFLRDDLSPTIAEHATQCQSLLHKYMVMPKIVSDPSIMDDQLARFSLWASNMDVYGPLNVSLDYRLRFSPTAADIIHQLLDIICETLLSCEYFPHHFQMNRRMKTDESLDNSEINRRPIITNFEQEETTHFYSWQFGSHEKSSRRRQRFGE